MASQSNGAGNNEITEDVNRLFLEQRQELAGMLQAHFEAQSLMLHNHALMPAVELPTGQSEEPGHAKIASAWAQVMPTSLEDQRSRGQSKEKELQAKFQRAVSPEDTTNGQHIQRSRQTSCDEASVSAQLRTLPTRTVKTTCTWSRSDEVKTRETRKSAFAVFEDREDRDVSERWEEKVLVMEKSDSTFGKARARVYIFLHDQTFKAILSFVILTNTVFIGISSHIALCVELYNPPGERSLGNFWEWLEVGFFIFFLGELIFRLWALQQDFITGSDRVWNVFDAVLVAQSALSLVLETMTTEVEGLPNMNFVRILRTLRFARVLRVIRVFKVFQSLRVMVISIVQSFLQLLWVFLLLLFVIYFFAIIFLHGVTDYVRMNTIVKTTEQFKAIRNLYGGLPDTLVTLFMGICGGKDWSDLLDPLLEISVLYGILFVFYIFFVVFGVLNVVTSIFVDSASQVSKRDRDIVTEQTLSHNKACAKNIRNFFFEADKDGSGTLSWEEFESYLQDEKVQAYFTVLGLDLSSARTLFVLLDVDESNSVGIEEFVFGCMRLRGDAKSIDVNMLLYENEKMIFQLGNFIEHSLNQFQTIQQALGISAQDATTEVIRKSVEPCGWFPDSKTTGKASQSIPTVSMQSGYHGTASRLDKALHIMGRGGSHTCEDALERDEAVYGSSPPAPPGSAPELTEMSEVEIEEY